MSIAAHPPPSLLRQTERHPLLPPTRAAACGTTLVVAPHPDDESLGCGGLLALLAESGNRVEVVIMTDGARSHPGSQSHPAERLARLREQETLEALATLGLPPTVAKFLRYPDCGLPVPGSAAFADAVIGLRRILDQLSPATLVVPWRRDPHGDHEATWALWRAAIGGFSPAPRWLEYPVWAWTQVDGATAPQPHEGRAWRLDITPVLARKAQAIAQHRSQLGRIIHDDPTGFCLAPEMLSHFARAWELFIEPTDV